MYEKRRVNYWVPIAIVIVLISLIVVYTSNQQNMNVYQGDNSTTSATEPTKSDVQLTTNKMDEINLSYGVPADWTKVVQSNSLTYVHAPSTSSFQISIKKYIPDLLTINQDFVMNALNAKGMSLISFQWNSNANFVVLYQKGMDDNAICYIDNIDFDQEHYVHTSYIFPAKYYDRMMPTVSAIIDSVKWNKEKPYPADMGMIYNGAANVEFSYPAAWQSGIKDNVLFSQDPNTGMAVSYVVNPSTVTYKNITQLDYLNWASAGRTNFALQSFECKDNYIKAVATYHANSQSMVLVQQMIATGEFEYIATFDVPQSAYKSQQKLIDTLIGLIKIYPTESPKEVT